MDRWALVQLLTRYIDGELTPAAVAEVERALQERPEVRNLERRLRRATGAAQEAILYASPPAAETASESPCLEADLFLRLAEGHASRAEHERAGEHLAACDQCLRRLVQDIRSTESMARGRWPQLPEHLQEDRTIRALLRVRQPTESNEEWREVSVSARARQALRHHLRAGTLTVHLSAEPRGDEESVGLELRLEDPAARVAGRTVTISDNQSGRKVVSGQADRDGAFRVRRLGAGSYTVHFLGSTAKIELTVSEEPPEA
jgi:hypothetical protein